MPVQQLSQLVLEEAGGERVEDRVQGAVYWQEKNDYPGSDCAWYFHSEEGKNFNYKYRNPADGIREHYKKEAVCNSHFSSNVIPHFWRLQGRFLNGTEHNNIGKHNDEKSQQVHT